MEVKAEGQVDQVITSAAEADRDAEPLTDDQLKVMVSIRELGAARGFRQPMRKKPKESD